ncbi:MAG: hypothetical protein IIA05_03765 [Proteobacteria bacterium]|nr:hypothetical protein [Pseudomonadota bacterium]
MNALEIVRAVQEHGAQLVEEDGRLVVKGTGERLPDDLRSELGQHKAAVLIALGCPFDRAVASILDDLRPHLAPALRALPDERLLALVNWHIFAAWEKALREFGKR